MGNCSKCGHSLLECATSGTCERRLAATCEHTEACGRGAVSYISNPESPACGRFLCAAHFFDGLEASQ